MQQNSQDAGSYPKIWTLLRDIGVFQVKLVIDGLRDFILVPASLVAGLISLAKARNGEPGKQFYELVGVGKQSEQWINLFGALKNAPPDIAPRKHFGDREMDDIVSRVEEFVVDEYKRGGVTAQARERLNEALNKLQERGQRPFREKGSDS